MDLGTDNIGLSKIWDKEQDIQREREYLIRLEKLKQEQDRVKSTIYEGYWSGNQIEFVANNGRYVFETKDFVKGFNCHVKVYFDASTETFYTKETNLKNGIFLW